MPSRAEIAAVAEVMSALEGECQARSVPCSHMGNRCQCWEAAERALVAAEAVREPVVFVTATEPAFRCTVNGPTHIVVEELS